MHVLAPRPSNPQLPLYFNVDTSVGQGGANSSREDILLVQFLLRKVGDASPEVPPHRREVMRNVDPTGVCDADTIAGIRAAQEVMRERFPSTVVDGKVSTARTYEYGRGVYTIVSLQVTLRRKFPKEWPRLDEFADCPPELKTRVPKIL
jgi:hypothetical protein